MKKRILAIIILVLLIPTLSTAQSLKAKRVRIVDIGGYYTSSNVEEALQEIGTGTIETDPHFNTKFSLKTTSSLSEGTNLYYTEARVSANASVTANTAKITESTTVTSPLVLTTYDISIPVATTSADGYLSSTDWDTFNAKADYSFGANNFSGTGSFTTTSTGSFRQLRIGTAETDVYIYFYEGGSHTGEYIKWDSSSDLFWLSDSVYCTGGFQATGRILTNSYADIQSYCKVGGDLYTTGAGDDLWLGTTSQASANFRAYADGKLFAKGYTKNIVTKTANYTLTATDDVVLGNTNAFTLTLPAAPGTGKVYKVKKINTEYDERLDIAGNGNLIDGETTYDIYVVNSGVTIIFDGDNWQIIGVF